MRESRDATGASGGGMAAATNRGVHGAHWLWLALVVIVLDQWTKHLVLTALRPGDEQVLLPVLSLVLAFNPGAAFSFLAGADGWQRWLFTAIALAACGFMLWLLRRGGSRLLCTGLALIVGGALGNLWDRMALGHVVDFVLVHYGNWTFPAFNVADSAITVGAAALILDAFRQRHAPQALSPRGR
jgi:signal peptidase II